MPIITPQWLADFESNMQLITETEYNRLSENLWYQEIVKERPSKTKRELVAWLVSTAQIVPLGKGGSQRFEDMVSAQSEFESVDSGTGLVIRKNEIEDLDGNGIQVASQWSADIGAYMAYYPQKLAYQALANGTTAKGYDGKAFFATDHPCNPNGGDAIYSNLIANVDISDTVTLDVALKNLGSVYAAISGIKMPNGVDPRYLRPLAWFGSPKLFPRMVQLSNAKTIAQAAATGGGGADVEALIKSLGFAKPIQIDEMAGTADESNYYVLAKQVSSSQLGALVYVNREPYSITYYTGAGGGDGQDAKLDRIRELEWHCHGRNVVGYGHPFLLFKCKAGA